MHLVFPYSLCTQKKMTPDIFWRMPPCYIVVFLLFYCMIFRQIRYLIATMTQFYQTFSFIKTNIEKMSDI